MKQFLIILAFVTLNLKLETLNSYAQQDPLFSQYRFDRLVINPAYAGSANSIIGTLGYRQQYVGLEGAPVTQVFGIHSPILKKSMGIGLKVIHDKIGVTEQTSIAAIYAYHLRLAKGKLSFGLEGGLLNQSTDFPALININTDADDPLLLKKESIMLPDAAFGVYYHSEKFYVGISVYHLLQSRLNYTNSLAQLSNHYFLTGGYSIDAGENIQLEPSLLLKYVSGAPVQTDINMNITYKEMFTLGGGYRTSDAIVFLFKYSFKERIKIGYAYDYTISKLASYNNGSHEIMLSYTIKLREPARKPVEPIYEEIIAEISPVDSLPEDTSFTAFEEISYEDQETFADESITDSLSSDTISEEIAIIEEEVITDTLSIDTSTQIVSMVEKPTTDTISADFLSEELAILEEDESEGEGESEEDSPTRAGSVELTEILPEGEGEPTREKTPMGSAKFEGVVTSNGQVLQGVLLKLIKGAEVINEIETSENGEFSFDILLPEGDYSLYVAKDGFIDRFYEISTINKDNNGIINKNFELIGKRF